MGIEGCGSLKHCSSCPAMKRNGDFLYRKKYGIRHASSMTILSPYDFFALEMPTAQRAEANIARQRRLRQEAEREARPGSRGLEEPPQGFLAKKTDGLCLAINSEAWHTAFNTAKRCRKEAHEWRELDAERREQAMAARQRRARQRILAPAEVPLQLLPGSPGLGHSSKPSSGKLPPSLLARQHFQVLPDRERHQALLRPPSEGNLGRPDSEGPYISRSTTAHGFSRSYTPAIANDAFYQTW